ncbi:hypothetical protein SUGI_0698200 [Cryptomeria japonica]|nr:hypothetical protein SUGI_0698200 [Cryptomeria japonica]
MSCIVYSFSLCDARKLTGEGSPLPTIYSLKAELEAANVKERMSSFKSGGLSSIFVEKNGHSQSHISHGESYASTVRKTLEDVHVNDHSPGIGHDDPPTTP